MEELLKHFKRATQKVEDMDREHTPTMHAAGKTDQYWRLAQGSSSKKKRNKRINYCQ
jgi:hypothetical protein